MDDFEAVLSQHRMCTVTTYGVRRVTLGGEGGEGVRIQVRLREGGEGALGAYCLGCIISMYAREVTASEWSFNSFHTRAKVPELEQTIHSCES